ncbi:MAG: hypothetical protein WC711_01235 [Candidatus Staskawiczbacteria bacterium]|jgi:predicted nucleic acid-binding protein
MKKVYLDSNILILGAERKEHEIVKNLSKDGVLILYISDHATVELHGKVFPLLREKDIALRIYDKLLPTGSQQIDQIVIDFVNKKRIAYENARKDEAEEWSYWKGVHLMPVSSKFAALWATSPYDSRISFYIQDELNLLEILINSGIDGKDSLHIVQAICGNIDYFLTWDKPLIKRIKKIEWLRDFKIMTPDEFLKLGLN